MGFPSSEEHSFLATVLGNVESAIVACDAQGVLTYFNEATLRLHGLPEQFLPPERWAEYYQLYRPDGTTPLPREEIPLYRAWKGEQVKDVEMVIWSRAGDRRTLLASGGPLVDDAGRIQGAVVSMHDITFVREAQRSREEKVREQEKRAAAEASERQLRKAEE